MSDLWDLSMLPPECKIFNMTAGRWLIAQVIKRETDHLFLTWKVSYIDVGYIYIVYSLCDYNI